jgi:hypothetical protein
MRRSPQGTGLAVLVIGLLLAGCGGTEAVNLDEAAASGNYWAASCVSGWLIQATAGTAGGWGGLRTNRSGWVA